MGRRICGRETGAGHGIDEGDLSAGRYGVGPIGTGDLYVLAACIFLGAYRRAVCIAGLKCVVNDVEVRLVLVKKDLEVDR